MHATLIRLALLGVVASAPALAQPSPAPMPGRTTGETPRATPAAPAPDRSGAAVANPGAERSAPSGTPVAGANSFTEGQARSRMEAAGFAGLTDLEKDDQGIWRGRGTRAGQPVTVMLDFQGNVTAR